MAFFLSGKPNSNSFYSIGKGYQGEPIIREEVAKIIEARGSWIIYRRARRDENGLPILSNSSINNRSSEALVDTNDGMRFLFDDYLMKVYISLGGTYHETGAIESYGDSRTDVIKMYATYDCISKITKNNYDIPDSHDKIITPVYDIDGKLKSPLQKKEMYDMGSCSPFCLDFSGRIEFYEFNLMTKHESSHRF